MNNPFTLIAL